MFYPSQCQIDPVSWAQTLSFHNHPPVLQTTPSKWPLGFWPQSLMWTVLVSWASLQEAPRLQVQGQDQSRSSHLLSPFPVGALQWIGKVGLRESMPGKERERGLASGCTERAPIGSWEIRHAFLLNIMYSHFTVKARNWSWREYLCYWVHALTACCKTGQ